MLTSPHNSEAYLRPGSTYELGLPTLGLSGSGDQKIPVLIPCGANLVVLRQTDGGTFVEVEWEGKQMTIFTYDLRDRGQPSNG